MTATAAAPPSASSAEPCAAAALRARGCSPRSRRAQAAISSGRCKAIPGSASRARANAASVADRCGSSSPRDAATADSLSSTSSGWRVGNRVDGAGGRGICARTRAGAASASNPAPSKTRRGHAANAASCDVTQDSVFAAPAGSDTRTGPSSLARTSPTGFKTLHRGWATSSPTWLPSTASAEAAR